MKIAMTGGHHSSAIPLIEYIYQKKPDTQILWFGHKHSMKGDKSPTMEYIQITSKNIPFIDLPAGKFYKTYNIFRLLKIPLGFVFSFFHLVKNRPDVIFSFGGYLAVPVVISGWVLGIPSITHEQTVVAGYANKLISKFSKKILISHEESSSHFPGSKTIYSGIPLRRALFEVHTDSFVFNNSLPVLYITAGKTGSHKINSAIASCLTILLKEFNVIHQCGDNSVYQDYENLTQMINSFSDLEGKYYVRKFVLDDEIGEVFTKADVFFSRAGAHIVAEIRAFKKPAVLIPIPWVSHNEQFLNAQVIVDLGLGIILPEGELTCDKIMDSLEAVLQMPVESNASSTDFTEEPLEIMYREMKSIYEKLS